ncbi:hypothetical protein [Anaerosporomusa subterranea]|nr:hypothetical protein [Anaerosporomusa subterranea]
MPADRDINGRNIADTKGIPLDNIVISEIPAKKANAHDLTPAHEDDHRK